MDWVRSESLVSEERAPSESRVTGRILTSLARGKGTGVYKQQSKEFQTALKSVGISEGIFTIGAGAGEHHYELKPDGKIVRLDKKAAGLNRIDWVQHGYQVGDTFKVFGKEYAIGEDGHINVSVSSDITTSEIVYPTKASEINN
jgi:hypothetical protein